LERIAALELLVRSRVALGDCAAAAETLRELESLASGIATLPLRGATSFSEGVVAVATGDYDTARRCFEDAVDCFGESGAPYETARSRLELASVLAGLGRADAARAEAGYDTLQRLGARREAERAATFIRQLSRLGRDGAPNDGAVPTLTPREVDVLRMVAQGLSDKEMAAVLGLSEHTIHRHVSNLLTKLDVPTRAAAVAHASQHGLL
jgi:LuxR family transcriptional regulator, maltose regulon positive regulatory protein